MTSHNLIPEHDAPLMEKARGLVAELSGPRFDADVHLAADPKWAMRFALDAAAVKELVDLAHKWPEVEALVLNRITELAVAKIDPTWASPHEAALVGLLTVAKHGMTAPKARLAAERVRAAPNALWAWCIADAMLANSALAPDELHHPCRDAVVPETMR